MKAMYAKYILSVFVSLLLVVSFNNCSQNSLNASKGVDSGTSSLSSQASAPDPQIIFTSSSPDVNNSNQLSASFKVVNDPGNLNIKCSLNNDSSKDCSSMSVQYTNLADGDYVLMVVAEPLYSLTKFGTLAKATSNSRQFRKDSAAPVITVSQTPPLISGTSSAEFIFTVTDNLSGVASIECSLDGANFSICQSPVQLINLLSTSHNFKIRATDKAGNVSVPYSYTWTVDLTVPVISITSKPNSITNQTSASISYSINVTGLNLECQIDIAGYLPCTSPISYSNLSNAKHTFYVQAKDSSGSVKASSSYSWIVDNISPSAPLILSSVNSPSKTNSVSYTFSSSDINGISSYQCSLDNAPFALCTSPKSFSGLSDGTHTFSVKAIDTAGNISVVSNLSQIIDMTPPVLMFTQTPQSSGTLTSASFAFSATDATSGINLLQCSTDNAVFANCVSPINLTNLSVGNHTFSVQASDKAGNIQLISYAWSITSTTGGTLNHGFPRLMGMNIGGKDYGNPDYMKAMAKLDIVIMGFYKGWRSNNTSTYGWTMDQVALNLKTLNPNLLVGQYSILNEAQNDTSSNQANADIALKLNAENWWARTAAGALTQWTSLYYAYDINITAFAKPDVNGLRYPEWIADRNNQVFFSRGAFDIIYTDNVMVKPRVTADFNLDGVDDNPTTIAPDYRKGHVANWNRYRSLQPNMKIMGNTDNDLSSVEFKGKIEGGFMECAFGCSWSISAWAGWSGFLTQYRAIMANTLAPHMVGVNVHAAATDYKLMRFSLTSTLMDDGYYCFSNTLDYNSNPWFDEFDNKLGTPVDGPQQMAYQNGVYLRRFQNGLAVVNPTNADVTITLPTDAKYRRINGTQDPVTNNGLAAGTSVIVKANDGLILMKM